MEYFIFMVQENIYFPKQFLFTMKEKAGYLETVEVKCSVYLKNTIRQVKTKPQDRRQILVTCN